MAATIMAQRRGGVFVAYSDADLTQAQKYPENTLLKLVVTGAKKVRAYRELCCYKGSCKYIASMAFNDRMDTQEKVNHMTKIKLDFVSDKIYHPTLGVQFIVKSLSYETCDQPESHDYIAKALKVHADLVGIDFVDNYIQLLREQK